MFCAGLKFAESPCQLGHRVPPLIMESGPRAEGLLWYLWL